MARTIMIADRVYEELKRMKGKDKSFTDVIAEALEASKPKKTIAGVLK
ncbi:antitoxin VapB family protein, partial [Candidatus Woesearchaeota archaeon]|nr:antitoxin VapB family protein [Candidatus Woesearchaeota archaeon]